MLKLRARAIIRYNEGLLMIHRIREVNGKKNEYYVFPGGGLEEGESIKECVIREAFEELSINIKVIKELCRVSYKEKEEVEVFFLCDYISGEFKLGNGPEFKDETRGMYIPEVIKIEELSNINIMEEVRRALKPHLSSCL